MQSFQIPRPPKKGAAVRLKELFVTHKEQFREAKTELYGKKENIRYYFLIIV